MTQAPGGGSADPAVSEGGGGREAAAAALERELYWAAPPSAEGSAGWLSMVIGSELATRWNELEDGLTRDYTLVFPPGEEVVEIGGSLKRGIKRAIFRVIRPVIRRYDRVGSEIARLGFETAQGVALMQRDLELLQAQVDSLQADMKDLLEELGRSSGQSSGQSSGRPPATEGRP